MSKKHFKLLAAAMLEMMNDSERAQWVDNDEYFAVNVGNVGILRYKHRRKKNRG